jgi:hypothetical protein
VLKRKNKEFSEAFEQARQSLKEKMNRLKRLEEDVAGGSIAPERINDRIASLLASGESLATPALSSMPSLETHRRVPAFSSGQAQKEGESSNLRRRKKPFEREWQILCQRISTRLLELLCTPADGTTLCTLHTLESAMLLSLRKTLYMQSLEEIHDVVFLEVLEEFKDSVEKRLQYLDAALEKRIENVLSFIAEEIAQAHLFEPSKAADFKVKLKSLRQLLEGKNNEGVASVKLIEEASALRQEVVVVTRREKGRWLSPIEQLW